MLIVTKLQHLFYSAKFIFANPYKKINTIFLKKQKKALFLHNNNQ
jgi:hypothetical protein